MKFRDEHGIILLLAVALGFVVLKNQRPKQLSAESPTQLEAAVLSEVFPNVDPVRLELFRDHHERALGVFDEKGNLENQFSFNRTGHGGPRKPSLRPHGVDFTYWPIFSKFDFALIGNDPDKRKIVPENEELANAPVVFIFPKYVIGKSAHGATPNGSWGSDEVGETNLDFGSSNSSADTVVKTGDDYINLPAPLAPAPKPELAQLSELDLKVLETFELDTSANYSFHPVADGAVRGYGSVRAKAACAKCHGVKEDTLLGLFRYEFKSQEGLEAGDSIVQVAR